MLGTKNRNIKILGATWLGVGALFFALVLSPNPPKDTDGRREESGRGVRELQGK